jgi:hypothetical protein
MLAELLPPKAAEALVEENRIAKAVNVPEFSGCKSI